MTSEPFSCTSCHRISYKVRKHKSTNIHLYYEYKSVRQHMYMCTLLMLQLLKGGSTESLQTILMCQVVHKNALISAVQQASACQPVRQIDLSRWVHVSPLQVNYHRQFGYIIPLTLTSWIILYKPWRPKGLFQFEIIINVFVSSFWFIWIPMLWVYGLYKYLCSPSQCRDWL